MRITIWPGSETFVKYTEARCGEQFVSDHGRNGIRPKSIMVNPGEVFMSDPSCVIQVYAPEHRWILVVVRNSSERGEAVLCEHRLESWKHPFLLSVNQ